MRAIILNSKLRASVIQPSFFLHNASLQSFVSRKSIAELSNKFLLDCDDFVMVKEQRRNSWRRANDPLVLLSEKQAGQRPGVVQS